MSLMLSKIYDALTAAGAPEEKARAAAKEIANYDNRFNRDNRFNKLEIDMLVVKWMLGVLIMGVASLIIKAFA